MSSQKYHAIFDYTLVSSDFPKWKHIDDKSITGITNVKSNKRLQREKFSAKKLRLARKAANILVKIPSVKFVGITGALAMMNADRDSDIDLIVITKKNTLWTSRLFCLIRLIKNIRRAGNKNEKDKLCLNMWLDESDLVWDKSDRNSYTAHEIAQIIPLVNKDKSYEKFLYLNRWILSFWPYAVSIKPYAIKRIKHTAFSLWQFIEKISFWIQYQYMKSKITREVIRPTRAIFHPNDWGRRVLNKLNKN